MKKNISLRCQRALFNGPSGGWRNGVKKFEILNIDSVIKASEDHFELLQDRGCKN